MARSIGRFNYMILRKDCCQIIFKPSDTPVQLVIAEDLTKDQACHLMDELNDAVDDTCNAPIQHGGS